MKMRTIAMALALTLSVSLLSACGSKDTTTTPTPEAPAISEPAAPEASQPEVTEPEATEPEVTEPETTEPTAPEASQPTDGVNLENFVFDLAEQYGENFPANANVVEFGMHNDLYPGIADIATEQLVIYQPMMGAVVCEIALAEVTDAADIEAVKAIFQSRIDAQVSGGAWYPESIRGWEENSRIVTNGNCVMMIAYSDCDAIVDAFNGLF